MSSTPRVALLIETSRAHGRGILRGVVRFQRQQRMWSTFLHLAGLEAPPPIWMSTWKGDGILARVNDLAVAKAIRATGLPCVDMRFRFLDQGFAGVGIDNLAVVQLAYEHLRDCGFQQFVCCGFPRGENTWMDLRCDEFERLATADGWACEQFTAAHAAESNWDELQAELSTWVAGLPKPIAVFACNDERGRQVLDACQQAQISVPDEVAVMGVDNDEILCEMANPPLSSVDIDSQRIGYEAAALLDRLMLGAAHPDNPTYLPPRGVVTRASTDVVATADRELATAIRLLRSQACDGLRLKEFVRQHGFSRRWLERRLHALLGRSPKEEVLRVQMEHACELLRESDQSVTAIARRCGFSHAKYFSEVFHKRMEMTPTAYRQAFASPLPAVPATKLLADR